jgi:RNA polymerase sigma factor (sigma-70 family)
LGNRFSTYATYAIRRNYFRTIVRSRKNRSRYTSDDAGLLGVAQKFSPATATDRQLVNLQYTFRKILNRLNDREQMIIRERFGFDSDHPKTFKELGTELGVCKERIRQIQARAMQKLKKFADEEHLLQTFDDEAILDY